MTLDHQQHTDRGRAEPHVTDVTHVTTTVNTKEINTTMNITSLPNRNPRPNGPDALDDRLRAFGTNALLKIAAGLMTTNRGTAVQVSSTVSSMSYCENVNDEQLADALDALAATATAEAATLRGTTNQATS